MSMTYGEPAPGAPAAPVVEPAPVVEDQAPVVDAPPPLGFVSQPAAVTSPELAPVEAMPASAPAAVDPAPALVDGQAPVVEPAAAAVPAKLPPAGTVARYTTYDAYASPARDRDQLVLVTGADETGVRGLVLGYADDAAAFPPDALTWPQG